MARVLVEQISLTETPQFKRLVEFASDVSQHASETHDFTLAEMIQNLHRDLLGMGEDDDG